MIQGIAIFIVFFVFAALMITRRISTLLALIFMAILIALIGGIPFEGKDGLLENVFGGGVTRLASAYTAVIFGAWLGEVMTIGGISRDMIRRAAELAGDRPMLVALAMAAVVAILFTTLAGLGAVIMVGTIVLPILLTAGLEPLAAAAVYLMGFTIGLTMNLSNWQTFSSVSKVPVEIISQFAVVQLVITAIVGVAFIVWQVRSGTRGARQSIAWMAPETDQSRVSEIPPVPIYALLTPFIPLVLVLVFKWNIIPAFFVGILYGALATNWRSSLSVITRAAHEGVKDGTPAILLMVAIGIVLNAVLAPGVTGSIGELLKNVVPSNPLLYALFFAVLAPLALYRGPLNMFGLGSGLVGLIVSLNILPGPAAIAGFMAAERTQSVGDPTNTQNVWTSDFAGVDVNALTLRLLPFLWFISACSAVAAAFIFLR